MDSITHIESTHSIYVNKLASHQVNKLNEFWGGYYRLLMSSLNSYDSDITRTQLNKLIKEIDLTITSNMEEWQEQLQLDLNEFAGYETDFQAKAIGGFTSEAIAVPATEQVIAAAISTPIGLGSAGAISLNPWLADLTRKQKTLIENEIKLGYANGVPTNQLVQRIVGTRRNNFTDGVADVTRRQAVTLVRTTTNHYASVARRNVYEKNKRVVIGHRWISTLDKRTSNICRGRDGKEYYYDSGESVEYPPAHPNCLLGDTNVSTSSRISNVYRRVYKGPVIDITTAGNRKISITPNHPILTDRGWIAAGEINCFDKVVTMDESLFSVDHDEYGFKATFEDIFSSLHVASDPVFVANSPTATEDFHGDGIVNHNVDIVNTDSFTRDAIKAIVNKEVENDWLINRMVVNAALDSFSPKLSFLNCCFSSFSGFMSCFGEFSNLFRSAASHSCELLLTSISELTKFRLKKSYYWCATAAKSEMLIDGVSSNAGFVGFDNSIFGGFVKSNNGRVGNSHPALLQSSGDCLRTAAEELGDLVSGNVIDGVHFDDVVDVCRRELDSTHVYNLENDVNWYLSNGIVTHNCRSTTSPIIQGYNSTNPKGLRAAKGGKMEDGKLKTDPGQASSATTYYEWLKNQPAQFQDEVLGKTKGKIFRNSGVTVDKFKTLLLDEMNKPATIAQLAAKDKKIAAYLANM